MKPAGRRRHYVTLERPTETKDRLGGYSPAWSAVSKTWVSIEPLSGAELVEAQAQEQHTTHRVEMRFEEGITSRMRIHTEDDRILNIASVINPMERRESLTLLCEEVSE